MSAKTSDYTTDAKQLGEEAGRAAASWVVDGNSDVEERRRVLRLMQAGDPEALDYLPATPDLSGEWADEPTPASVFEEIVGRPAVLDSLSAESEDGGLMDALCDAWEEGVSEAFAPECERLLIAFTDPAYLPEFLSGYLRCALWSSDLDDRYSAEDIADEATAQARSDCRAFMEANADDLDRFADLTGRNDESHGHDLWLSRNGHGTGFWDRYMDAERDDRPEAEDIGDRLSDAARALGEAVLYPGDDGQLYLS